MAFVDDLKPRFSSTASLPLSVGIRPSFDYFPEGSRGEPEPMRSFKGGIAIGSEKIGKFSEVV